MVVRYEYVAIKTPDNVHRNYGLEVLSRDSKKVQDFEILFYERFSLPVKGILWRWFFQGGHDSKEWRYFEFWKTLSPEDHDTLLDVGEEFAQKLNLSLTIL